MYALFLFILLSVVSLSCQEKSFSSNSKTLYQYFSDDNKTILVKLPGKLDEISGLATTTDGRLFAHDDEKGTIYQLDYKSGTIIKKFSIGKNTIKEDFEGLAIAGKNFYLVNSSGELYKFKEGGDGGEVKYKKYKTFLSAKNDVEGLCYDEATNALLLACKGSPGKGYSGSKAVYSFSLEKNELNNKPRFLLPIKEIVSDEGQDFTSKMAEFFLLKENIFSPSGIERHPKTGNFYIISARGNKMIIEVSPGGKILDRAKLNPAIHQQPEGIAFLKDYTLVISDESVDRKATITRYPYTKR